MWKLKKKILPKSTSVPTAMKNKEGKLLTKKTDIKKHTMDYYKNVLRNRDIKPGLEKYKTEREMLCHETLEHTKTVKTPPWTKSQICRAMKGLKSRKSRDPHKYG